jgi:hypothetical protein
MKELTRDQKIAVVEKALLVPNDYLCHSLAVFAKMLRFITLEDWKTFSNNSIARTLIPEILLFKPKGKRDNELWFGDTRLPESIEKRRKVLEELLDMLKNQE